MNFPSVTLTKTYLNLTVNSLHRNSNLIYIPINENLEINVDFWWKIVTGHGNYHNKF